MFVHILLALQLMIIQRLLSRYASMQSKFKGIALLCDLYSILQSFRGELMEHSNESKCVSINREYVGELSYCNG